MKISTSALLVTVLGVYVLVLCTFHAETTAWRPPVRISGAITSQDTPSSDLLSVLIPRDEHGHTCARSSPSVAAVVEGDLVDTPESSQYVGSIHVLVLDSDRKAVASRVVLRLSGGGIRHVVDTNKFGEATFAQIPFGEYSVSTIGGGLRAVSLRTEKASVEILLPTVDALAIRVVDDFGSGIARAKLYVSVGGDVREGILAGKADESGFLLMRPAAVGQFITARAEGFNASPALPIEERATAREHELTIVLQQGGFRMTGRVISGADGRPIAGA